MPISLLYMLLMGKVSGLPPTGWSTHYHKKTISPVGSKIHYEMKCLGWSEKCQNRKGVHLIFLFECLGKKLTPWNCWWASWYCTQGAGGCWNKQHMLSERNTNVIVRKVQSSKIHFHTVRREYKKRFSLAQKSLQHSSTLLPSWDDRRWSVAICL